MSSTSLNPQHFPTLVKSWCGSILIWTEITEQHSLWLHLISIYYTIRISSALGPFQGEIDKTQNNTQLLFPNFYHHHNTRQWSYVALCYTYPISLNPLFTNLSSLKALSQENLLQRAKTQLTLAAVAFGRLDSLLLVGSYSASSVLSERDIRCRAHSEDWTCC